MKKIIFIGLLVLVVLVSGCVKEQKNDSCNSYCQAKKYDSGKCFDCVYLDDVELHSECKSDSFFYGDVTWGVCTEKKLKDNTQHGCLCFKESETTEQKQCTTDTDCACGTHISTGDCFYGNKNYVNTEQQCPDFCTGITGHFKIECINNQCQQIEEPNPMEYTFDWSDGTCNANSDCQDLEYGCGGGHIVCTNNPEKWKDMMSTCDIVANHPVKEGYQCGCVLSENKCGWVR